MKKLKQIRELLVDLYGCKADLDNVEFLIYVLEIAAQEMGSKIIKTTSHKFSPEGTTVIIILAETHISIHTWPEHKYAALDIFICSEEIDPEMGWQAVKDALQPSSFEIRRITRKIE
ncbi:MAG: adenosylmethionine decarboxylase [Candidatus Bathyarchaeota archaeon]|nr:adenosylmethionine decarboxylase [Candidatus Bathyarchaeota archaeon]